MPTTLVATAGRKTRLTDDLIRSVCASIERGNYADTALRAHGIPRSTFYAWLQRGRKGDEPYRTLVDAIEVAGAKAEMTLLATVAAGDPLANGERNTATHARWILERTRHRNFGKDQAAMEVAAEISGFLDVLERTISEDDYIRFLVAWQDETVRGQPKPLSLPKGAS
ncbi:MAG: hypothetical protein HRU17_14615 [Polyangiaceae bacterium]|nr:hypothetical protein [Polyangiaceae bacterium]